MDKHLRKQYDEKCFSTFGMVGQVTTHMVQGRRHVRHVIMRKDQYLQFYKAGSQLGTFTCVICFCRVEVLCLNVIQSCNA